VDGYIRKHNERSATNVPILLLTCLHGGTRFWRNFSVVHLANIPLSMLLCDFLKKDLLEKQLLILGILVLKLLFSKEELISY
jgi:hypothetical protein